MARRLFGASRILVNATCSASQPELEFLQRKRRLHALRVDKCPITAHGTSLGTAGYVDDFARHLLGAGVCESDKWRPSTATHHNLARRGQAEERPEEAEQPGQPEEESNAMQMEDEEDPLAWTRLRRIFQAHP